MCVCVCVCVCVGVVYWNSSQQNGHPRSPGGWCSGGGVPTPRDAKTPARHSPTLGEREHSHDTVAPAPFVTSFYFTTCKLLTNTMSARSQAPVVFHSRRPGQPPSCEFPLNQINAYRFKASVSFNPFLPLLSSLSSPLLPYIPVTVCASLGTGGFFDVRVDAARWNGVSLGRRAGEVRERVTHVCPACLFPLLPPSCVPLTSLSSCLTDLSPNGLP